MGGGTTEVHRDSEYLATGTHKGADSSTTLVNRFSQFASCGVVDGLYIENDTQGTSSYVATANEREVTTDDDISWDYGDTYYIYKTGTKDSLLSTQWIDLSRGWKSDPDTLEDGWKPEDVDLDDDGERVFGPGQPE